MALRAACSGIENKRSHTPKDQFPSVVEWLFLAAVNSNLLAVVNVGRLECNLNAQHTVTLISRIVATCQHWMFAQKLQWFRNYQGAGA